MKRVILFIAIFCLAILVNGQAVRKYIVAADGTGNYKTVQQAFDAVPLNNQVPIEIFIRKGIYKEKLHLDSSKNFVTLTGEDKNTTILTFDDHTGTVTATGEIINTMTSQSFYIKANDFRAENLTFENNAGMMVGQAVAIRIDGDRVVFTNCRILGFQDTLFTSGSNSRQYYRDCYIEGSTDFIFGASTALFEYCHIHSKKNSHVTAASTPAEHSFGYVFKKCILTADTAITKVSLGRPWRPYASVTYLYCTIGTHIIPQGWDNWKNIENEKTARYAEYQNEGPGANTSNRFTWTKQLTPMEAKTFTTAQILRNWIPFHTKPFVEPE